MRAPAMVVAALAATGCFHAHTTNDTAGKDSQTTPNISPSRHARLLGKSRFHPGDTGKTAMTPRSFLPFLTGLGNVGAS